MRLEKKLKTLGDAGGFPHAQVSAPEDIGTWPLAQLVKLVVARLFMLSTAFFSEFKLLPIVFKSVAVKLFPVTQLVLGAVQGLTVMATMDTVRMPAVKPAAIIKLFIKICLRLDFIF
jgi:hypothetical protein